MFSLKTFSDRERHVIRLHNMKFSDAHIAQELGLHRTTVTRTRIRAFQKLEEVRGICAAFNRGELISYITGAIAPMPSAPAKTVPLSRAS